MVLKQAFSCLSANRGLRSVMRVPQRKLVHRLSLDLSLQRQARLVPRNLEVTRSTLMVKPSFSSPFSGDRRRVAFAPLVVVFKLRSGQPRSFHRLRLLKSPALVPRWASAASHRRSLSVRA